MKTRIIILALLLPFAALAQVPRTVSLQGALTDNSGKQLPDGAHSVTVRLYAAASGGSALHSESFSTLLRGGVFSVILGSTTPIPASVTFDAPCWLGFSVDGGAELSPRTPLNAVPYALSAESSARAKEADHADAASTATTAQHAATADVASALSSGATGVVTSINGADGAVTLQGAGGTSVTRSGTTVTISSSGGGGTGIAGLQNTDGTIEIQNPNGPVAAIAVADQSISNTKLAQGSVGNAQLMDGAVGTAKLADAAVDETKLANAAVGANHVKRGSLYADHFAPGSITLDRLNVVGARNGQVPTVAANTVIWSDPPAGTSVSFPLSDTIAAAAPLLDLTNTTGSVLRAIAPDGNPTIYAETQQIPLGTAIKGKSAHGTGVHGEGSIGVGGTGNASGVQGFSQSNYGVYGISSDGTGVQGSSSTSTGVAGFSNAKAAGVVGTVERAWLRANVGVLGFAPSGEGVCGESETGIGVRGWSQSGDGVVGRSTTGTGVHGFGTTQGPGVFGQSSSSQPAMQAMNSSSGEGLNASAMSGTGVYAWSTTGVALKAHAQNGDVIHGYIGPATAPNICFRVTNAGNVYADGTYHSGGADLAESFDFEDTRDSYEPGDVLVISEQSDMKVTLSRTPYDHRVIGVFASKPGVVFGHSEAKTDRSDRLPVGVVGIVPTKVCDEGGPIRRGDLLTTSSAPGHAMKLKAVIIGGIPSFPSGVVLGKALENFDGPGTGLIRVFVNTK